MNKITDKDKEIMAKLVNLICSHIRKIKKLEPSEEVLIEIEKLDYRAIGISNILMGSNFFYMTEEQLEKETEKANEEVLKELEEEEQE